jgi:hypothetical protein
VLPFSLPGRRRAVLDAAVQPLEPRMLLSTVSIANATANEGSPLLFTVSLDAAASSPITLNYGTANKTAKAGHDYTTAKGTLTFAAGQTSQTITVDTLDNGTSGPDLTMYVKLSKPTKGVTISSNQAIGTIDNIDPAPVVTVSDPAAIPAFSKGSKTLTFTIKETGTSTSKSSVQYSTQDLTAIAGTNYIAKTGIAKFSGNKTFFAVQIKILPDATLSEDKDFLLQLSAPSNATIGSPAYGVGVIGTTGNTTGATISATSSITTAPGAPASIAVSLSEPAADPVTVNYATSDGNAIAGTDYTNTTGTLTFPVGTTSQTITVPTLAASAGGTFDVTLSSANNGTISAGTSVVTITPSLSISNINVLAPTSGSSTADFTVTLSAAIPQAVTLNYATSDGTAIAGTNYTAASGTLTIPANSTSVEIPVMILGNIATTGAFTITLSSPANATISTATATAAIQNPSLFPSISVNNPTVDQATSGTTTANFTVTLSAPSSQAVQVTYATADGSAAAGVNYTAANGTRIIPAGATSGLIQVTILGNVTTSANFTLNLSSPVNAMLITSSAMATITNAATALPSLSISNLTVDEASSGVTTANFTVALSATSAQDVQVSYTTADGTALAGTNYTVASGSVTIPSGSVTAQIPVTILGDVSGSATFSVNLSTPVNAVISNASAMGVIENNAAALPTLSVADVSKDEGTGSNSIFDFPVTLSAASAVPVSVNYATADGTATGAAVGSSDPDTDYYSASGTLTFLPGTLSEDIVVTVLGDTTVEQDETFTVALSNPVNAALNRARATGTILNDDTAQAALTAITVNNTSVAQASGGSTAAFLVSLAFAATQNVTVFYGTSDGSAIAGTDYTATSGMLTFTPGQTSEVVDVPVLDNTSLTANSADFSLTLLDPSANATLANTVASGTIYNSNGIKYGSSNTGFSSTISDGVTHYVFNYSIVSIRADALADAQIQFFLTSTGQDLDDATPFRVADVGEINAGQTVSGSIDLSGAPVEGAGMTYSARLISTIGTVTIVYDLNTLSINEEPG